MEDNSNMPGSTTSEADEIGGNGEDVSNLVEQQTSWKSSETMTAEI